MRGALIAGLVAVVLAGCRIAGPGAQVPAAESVISEQVLPPPAGLAAEAPVAVPAGAAEAAPEPAPGPLAPALADQRRLCERGGGQLAPRGPGLFACVRPTRDGGRRCDAARDCEGLCLARSGTCAPIAPLFGCQEVFTLPGRRETLCTE